MKTRITDVRDHACEKPDLNVDLDHITAMTWTCSECHSRWRWTTYSMSAWWWLLPVSQWTPPEPGGAWRRAHGSSRRWRRRERRRLQRLVDAGGGVA